MWFVVMLSLFVAVVSLALSVLVLRRTAQSAPAQSAPAQSAPAQGGQPLPQDVEGLRREVAALQQATAGALRHLAVVRYDAFGDMGGHLSWSVALLDDEGSGVVMTSIHGRSEARTYAKTITAWTSEAQLSPEEEDAVANARA